PRELRHRSLSASVGGGARAAVAERGAVDEDLAVLPARQDHDADAGARRHRRRESAASRRRAAGSGLGAARPRNRVDRLSRRDALDSAAIVPEGSVRALHRVVLEVLEAEGDELLAIRGTQSSLRSILSHLPGTSATA